VHPEQQRRPVADRGSAGLLARLISVVPVAAGPPERIHRYTADRLFHEGTGVSFQVWRDAWRERKARELLVNRPELSIKEIAVMVGLGGSGALRRLMRRRLGLTPTQIRDGSRT
jgi:methylphosphotriester-DNA--protein-cysteine methyltransferase